MDTNISLKDLVKIIDDHQKKYNDDEEKKYNDDEIEFFKTIILSFSENEWSDKDKHLSEFKGLLHDLNELLDKEDVSSTDIIDRRYLDTRLVLLKNNILGAIKFEKPAKKNSTQSNTKKNNTQSNTKKNSTQSNTKESSTQLNAKESSTQSNTKENDVDPGRIMYYFDSKNEDKSNKIIKTQRGVIIISSIALLASLFATGYVLIKDAKSDKNKDDNNSGKFSMSRISQRLKDTRMYYDSKNNEAKVLVEDEELVLVEEEDKPLTTENFNNFVNTIETKFSEKSLAVSKEDIRKFAMIINIDQLAQDNKELIAEIIGSQNAEEVFADADSVINTIMNYNYQYYYDDDDAIIEAYLANKAYKHSIDGFVKLSDFIYNSEQKEIVMEIESRISEINNFVDDNEKMNELVHALLKDMISATSKLSMLEDGTNYAVEWVYIELIRGLFGMDLDGKSTLNATNADLVKYYVSYVEDDKAYYDNSSVNGSVRNINNLLNDCKEKTLTK